MTEKVKAALKASKKLDEKSKAEVFEVFCKLEGELQAKDIAIATLKSECLKHLLHNLRSEKDLLCDPVLALNRDCVKDNSAIGRFKTAVNSASSAESSQNDQTAHKLVALCSLVESQKSTLQRLTSCLSDADKQRSALLKDLEEERRKNSDLAKQAKDLQSIIQDKAEKDKDDSQKQTDSSSDSEELKKLQATLTSERKNTKDMIVVLMEDRRKLANLFMEEKRRSEELSRQLREEKARVRALGLGLEEESKRSLAMEAELERHLAQINSQADDLQAVRINSKDLEDALRKARSDAEHFKKQLSEAHRVAMSQATAAAAPLYVTHSEALSSSSISPSSTSSMSGLTASSLVTAAIGGAGKQSLGYDYTQQASSVPKSRSSISSTATMVPNRGGHRVVPNVSNNSFQVNGSSVKKAPPIPPNKPSVSIYKPLSKLEGIVNSPSDARTGTTAIDLAK